MSVRVPRVERDRAAVSRFRFRPFPVQKKMHRADRSVRLRQVGIGGDGAARGFKTEGTDDERRCVAADRTGGMGVRNPRPGKRIVGVARCGPCEAVDGAPGRLRRQLIPEIAAPQVEVIRLCVAGVPVFQRRQTVGRQLHAYMFGQRRAELALELDEAVWLAVERRGPDLRLIGDANQP